MELNNINFAKEDILSKAWAVREGFQYINVGKGLKL